jgi:hypothetical protein
MSITSQIEPLSIWIASDQDRADLARLAQLDSAAVPTGTLLVAAVGDTIRAALAIESGTVIADPFHRTAELVSLLRARAEQARSPLARRPRIVARTPARARLVA